MALRRRASTPLSDISAVERCSHSLAKAPKDIQVAIEMVGVTCPQAWHQQLLRGVQGCELVARCLIGKRPVVAERGCKRGSRTVTDRVDRRAACGADVSREIHIKSEAAMPPRSICWFVALAA